jgi:hypothetical protein
VEDWVYQDFYIGILVYYTYPSQTQPGRFEKVVDGSFHFETY